MNGADELQQEGLENVPGNRAYTYDLVGELKDGSPVEKPGADDVVLLLEGFATTPFIEFGRLNAGESRAIGLILHNPSSAPLVVSTERFKGHKVIFLPIFDPVYFHSIFAIADWFSSRL